MNLDFLSLCLLWRFSHTLLKLSTTWQGEGCNVMYIPSASLSQLGEAVSGSRRAASSPLQEAEDWKGDDVEVFQFLLQHYREIVTLNVPGVWGPPCYLLS